MSSGSLGVAIPGYPGTPSPSDPGRIAAVSESRQRLSVAGCRMVPMTTATRRLDAEACYRAVSSRDRRFDGVFFIAVRTTGIYCRPSCPARTPALRNVEFHPTAAAAQAAGLPGLQALPARCDAGQPRVGRRRRRRGPGDAADLRRRRRPQRRRRSCGPRRLHPASPEPAAHRRARSRPARPGAGAPGPDGAGADRDHRPPVRRDRVRLRLRQHPSVQRHGPRGLRAVADRSCVAAGAAPTRRRGP